MERVGLQVLLELADLLEALERVAQRVRQEHLEQAEAREQAVRLVLLDLVARLEQAALLVQQELLAQAEHLELAEAQDQVEINIEQLLQLLLH